MNYQFLNLIRLIELMITIKRTNTDLITVNPLPSSNMTKAVMGDEQITLVWEQNTCTPLYLNDYITYEGSKWTLNQLPTIKKLSSKLFQYNAIFQSSKYDLGKVMYMLFDNTSTPPQGEFPLTGNADMFIDLLIANLNRIHGSNTWTKGDVIQTDYKLLTFSNESCLSVLERLASEFDTEYIVNGSVIHLDKKSTTRNITLKYGSTAYDIERTSVNDSNVVTRLYPFGSTRNIASDYRNGSDKLLIPAPNLYIESNIDLYGIIEASKTFDDIYPRLDGTNAGKVTAIDESNELVFFDSALDFDVNSYLLSGTTAKVHFNTGDASGYDYEIKSYTHNTRKFILIANTSEKDYALPNATLRPKIGDKYVLLDIVMPDSYKTSAENELLAAAQKWLIDDKNNSPKVEYKATFSSIYAIQNLQNVECGDTVPIYDEDLGIDENIRIVKIQKGITDFWTVQFDLSNTVSATRLERIEGGLSNVQNTVITSNERVNRNNLRAYQQTKELQGMVFDPEGYFNAENIKPLSIETSMLSVGARSQSFQLTCILQPNYNGNPQILQWTAGELVHFTIDETGVRNWIISSGSLTLTGSNDTIHPMYIYARCKRNTNVGDIFLSADHLNYDSSDIDYLFLVGVLHSPIGGIRGISLSYGMTIINGSFVKLGVISSMDESTYFDLVNNKIKGYIEFMDGIIAGSIKLSSDGTIKAGINGDSLSDIAAWFGGTEEDAIAAIAKIILYKNGGFQFGGGSFRGDAAGNIITDMAVKAREGYIGDFTIFEKAIINDSIEFSDTEIEPLDSLINPAEEIVNRTSSWTANGIQYATAVTGTLTTSKAGIVDFQIFANVQGGRNTEIAYPPQPSGLTGHATDITLNVWISDENNNTVFSDKSICGDNGCINKEYSIVLNKGNFVFHALAEHRLADQSAYVEIIGNYNTPTTGGFALLGNTDKIGLYRPANNTKIGIDGFYSELDALRYLYYKATSGLKLKGARRFFNDSYRGYVYTNNAEPIINNIANYNSFILEKYSNDSVQRTVHFPTPTELETGTDNFWLRVVVGTGGGSIKLESKTGAQMYNEDGNTRNYVGMTHGDVIEFQAILYGTEMRYYITNFNGSDIH